MKMIELDDDIRERLIERYKQSMLAAKGVEWRRYWQGKMFALIKGRSTKRVDQMEREQGMEKVARQMAPWSLK